MRSVSLRVGGTPIGKAMTWAYPNGKGLGVFEIPTYQMRVTGTNRSGTGVTKDFEVFRFGVSCKDGKTATVVGLADHQTHVLKQWIPTYSVHSATSPEDDGWQVYGNFLIHDGPDDATELFASIGCIEVMGPRGFVRFNDLVIELSGATGRNRDEQLRQIARARRLSITYDRAARPPLVPLP
jgi:hypothetical protein